MKIVLTGSLGYIGQPLTEKLIQKGHSVTVISSSTKRKEAIEKMGAKAAIGSMDDLKFLTEVFTSSDAVYCMLAPYGDFSDPLNDADAIKKRANDYVTNYLKAIEGSGVKRVVYLSSIGADREKDTGLISVHYAGEMTIKKLPDSVNLSIIRPGGFYKNLFAYIHSIKHQDCIMANYGGEDKIIWVSNLDIADAIIEEIESQEDGQKVRYVASDELTCNETAQILGTAIGKPHLKWITLNDKEQLNGMIAFGMNKSIAQKFVEMNASIHDGKFYNDYYLNKPVLGKVKMKDFAQQFATVYNNN